MAEVRIAGDLQVTYAMTGNGPPLLLIHGAEASHQMFDALVPLLAEHFTVVAYDQRDCGTTVGPEIPATLQVLADDANALLVELGFRSAHVFGSSFGGRIAQLMAARPGSIVDHLVLGSTWALPQGLETLNPAGVQRIQALRQGLPATSPELAAMFFPADYLAANPPLIDFFRNVRPSSARSARRALAVASTAQISLSQVVAPTLLLAGDNDLVVPASVTFDIASQIRGCERVLLPGVGHATCLQAPQAVARAITHFIHSTHGDARRQST